MKLYQVDAFAEKAFTGNPAAIVPLEEFLPEKLMQDIALENNLAETAYFVKSGDEYKIRWFTPTVEVDLCGHATLAAAHVLFNHLGYKGSVVNFHSHRSGPLKVYRNNDLLTLDFPADKITQVTPDTAMLAPFKSKPIEVWKGKTDLMFVFDQESFVRDLVPNLAAIAALPCRGIIVTAKGNQVDFVSRFFGPQSGVNEDPVTGSAHTTLTPYWAKKLGKKELSARQMSPRGGNLQCIDKGERVHISGKAITYLVGDITW